MRSADAHDDALRAAVQILEDGGYAAITIERVAARSGVAKSTIYRWWSSKAELVMEAYGHLVAERMPMPDSGRLAEDLTTFVTALYRVVEHPTRVRALRGLMAEAQLDPAFAEAFRGWVRSRRDVLAVVFTRAIDRGELPAGLDVDHAVDLVFGPFWYRLLVEHLPVDAAEAPAHVRRLLYGLNDAPPES
ncbi:TetR/AcrR family transcriptional regulator [Sphaerisporangium rhizosphaerae]|uniref:TetR/AcrR family transcriptional regulator n=1 Tax=Sphaerisporangium rhizosphaerae TaxID=2269375 RepID=A0ABW2PBW0_9ACTN